MMKLRYGIVVGAMFAAGAAQAGSLQASATNSTIGASVNQHVAGPFNVDFGYMHNYENDSELVTGGAHLDFGFGPFGVMAGVRGYYSKVDGLSGTGFAPGVGASFKPIPLVTLSTTYYYSDDSMSDDPDVERYRDWTVGATMHPAPLTNIFVGYGFKSVDMKGSGETIMNDGPIVSAGINF